MKRYLIITLVALGLLGGAGLLFDFLPGGETELSVQAAGIRAFSLKEACRRLKGEGKPNNDLLTFGGITRFAGMVFDRETSDVILVGKVLEDQPTIAFEDLVVALRCRLLEDQYPLVSIDRVQDTAKTGLQEVRFQGGIKNTRFGQDFLDSDVLLKKYSLNLLNTIKGLQSYLKLYEDAARKKMEQDGHAIDKVVWLSEVESGDVIQDYRGKAAKESETIQSRFWFYAMEDDSYIVELDDVYVIEELRLGVKAQLISDRTVNEEGNKASLKKDEMSEEFASQFTRHYGKVCQEYPAVRRLKALFDLVAISEGISHLDENRPGPVEYLIKQYPVSFMETPKEYPLIQRLGVISGQHEVSKLLLLSGGVELRAILLALEDGDVTALKKAVLKSRPGPNSLCWTLPLEAWVMPNDEFIEQDNQQLTAASSRTVPDSGRLGCTLGIQSFLFDSTGPGNSDLIFEDFPEFTAVPPLAVPSPLLSKKDRLGGVYIDSAHMKRTQNLSLEEMQKLQNEILNKKRGEKSPHWEIEIPK